jgi:hypothetical protein
MTAMRLNPGFDLADLFVNTGDKLSISHPHAHVTYQKSSNQHDDAHEVKKGIKHKRGIHGRLEEQADIYKFMLPSVQKAFADLATFHRGAHHYDDSKDIRKQVIAAKLEISLLDTTKLCILYGPSGIGKTSFVNHFSDLLKNIQRIDKQVNFSVFQNKSTSFNNSEPFGAWIAVAKQMLTLLSRENMSANQQNESEGAANEDTSKRKHKTRAEHVNMGLDYLLPFLSAEQRELKPLLATVHIISGSCRPLFWCATHK